MQINNNLISFYDFEEEITTDDQTQIASHLEKSAQIKESATKALAQTILMTGLISALDVKVTPFMTNLVSQKLGLCVSSLFSQQSMKAIASFVKPLGQLNNKFGSLFSNKLISKIFIPSLCEELEFRWFVQEIILRKLPQKLIEKISPDLTYLIDSMPARISRVAAAAFLFTLCHSYVLECEKGGGIEQLIGGLLYGGIYEFTDYSLPMCINLHIIYNFIIFSQNGFAKLQ